MGFRPFLNIVAVLFLVPSCADTVNQDQQQQLRLGERMYLEGIRPDGRFLTGLVNGDISMSGENVVCGNCHRRSGLGSSEGNEVVPGVTADLLYKPLTLPTNRPPAPPEIRPAYTDESVRSAIQKGIGVSGQPLSVLMPRFDLDDAELDAVLAYMRTLSASISPGVTEQEIHFATVVSDQVSDAQRNAMLTVLKTFIEQKNVETRNEGQRAESSPWHKEWAYASYRKWVLHVFEVTGDESSWKQQLQKYYEETPVFAMLSGIASGTWQPVHEFCAEEQIPCVLPNTDLPVTDTENFYNVYFTKGIELEAQTIASFLRTENNSDVSVTQLYKAGDAYATHAAHQVTASLGERVKTSRLDPEAASSSEFWSSLFDADPNGAYIIWLPAEDQGALWAAVGARDHVSKVFLSEILQQARYDQVPLEAQPYIYYMRTYALPDRLPKLLARSSGWLKSRRIYAPEHKRIQSNTFFALKTVGGALAAIRGYFHRDYFIEKIEHMIDNASYTGVYTHVSLAPNQRFLSKGGYVVQVSTTQPTVMTAVGGWRVP